MVSDKGESWGEMSQQQDHIYYHVFEKYYVPSLVLRAIKMYPVAPVAQWCLGAVWNPTEDGDKFLTYSTSGIGWQQIQKSIYRYCLHYAPYDEKRINSIKKEVAA